MGRAVRGNWLRHPWLPQATVGDRVMGPREVAWIERPVEVLAEAGLTGPEQMDAVLLLCGHVRNTLAPTMSGSQPWTPGEGFGSLHERLERRADEYAGVLDATRAGQSEDYGWRFGLELILEGLAVRVGRLVRE